MRINQFVPNTSQILIEKEIMNYTLAMKDIPNGKKVDGNGTVQYEFKGQKVQDQELIYKWNKRLKNWEVTLKSNKKDGTFRKLDWELLKKGQATDLDGDNLYDAEGKPVMTQYTARWRKYIELAQEEIDGKDKGQEPATATPPIKHEQKTKINGVEYIYDEFKNRWYDTTTKQEVYPNGVLHAMLMAEHGFNPDGKTELSDTFRKQIKDFVKNRMLPKWLTKGGTLGAGEKDNARNIGGVIGSQFGDILGRGLIAALGIDNEDYIEVRDREQKKKDRSADLDDVLDLDSVANESELKQNFKTSFQSNPDIPNGAKVQDPKNPTKYWTWEIDNVKGSRQWRSPTGQFHTVLPNIHNNIVKKGIPEDQLQDILDGKQIEYDGKAVTPGVMFHLRNYATYHAADKK